MGANWVKGTITITPLDGTLYSGRQCMDGLKQHVRILHQETNARNKLVLDVEYRWSCSQRLEDADATYLATRYNCIIEADEETSGEIASFTFEPLPDLAKSDYILKCDSVWSNIFCTESTFAIANPIFGEFIRNYAESKAYLKGEEDILIDESISENAELSDIDMDDVDILLNDLLDRIPPPLVQQLQWLVEKALKDPHAILENDGYKPNTEGMQAWLLNRTRAFLYDYKEECMLMFADILGTNTLLTAESLYIKDLKTIAASFKI